MPLNIRSEQQQANLDNLLTKLKTLLDIKKVDPTNFQITNEINTVIFELKKIPV
jgi:hypothetical protein